LIVLGLFWWKRKRLLQLPLQTWWPGLLLIALGLVLHIGFYIIQQPKLSIVAMLVGIYGVMGLAWGWRFLLASFFPFFLLIFCVPLGSTGQGITWPLRLLVAKIVAGIAHCGLAPGLVRQGTQLLDPQSAFSYDIAPACSGIRSLVSLLALTTIYGFISFKTTWKRLLMVAAAFPLAVLGNVVRLTFTVTVAELFGQEAGSWVETKFGFVTFAVALGCVLLIGHWLRERPIQENKEVLSGLEEVKTA
jgi:exosortase